ncbi:hypothetical protein TNCT_605571 [Trichonephila clavata]|uniref:Uncharacterized protein n=1 Tax=Trichonephila clavata TaxID=2740835 RepID=A0A8X6FHQ4_TRICU|nr:hypothetical protein TNCT_605571 [Trichonephila clavata]
MLSFSGKKSRGEQEQGLFLGMVSTGKRHGKGQVFSISGKNVEEGKEQGLCSTGQGREARSKESNGGVVPTGDSKDPR